ncbi:MAG: hypothetical protein AB7F28_03130 [Candidatus Margulisiibacteriota bacterium]
MAKRAVPKYIQPDFDPKKSGKSDLSDEELDLIMGGVEETHFDWA